VSALRPIDRYRGALLGLAAGDALGTAVEFQAPGSFAPLVDMVGGGSFRLPLGAWTDDTSMALCLAESLIECGGFDPEDQLRRYLRWYRQGYWSSTGVCFDIGNATRAALERFERTGEAFPGDADRDAAGNGPLMKLAPVPLAYAADPAAAVAHAAESARTTHGARQAVDAARYFAAVLVGALHGADDLAPIDALGAEPLHPEVARVAAGSYREKEPPAIEGSGYVVRSLEAALWAVHRTETYADAVLAAANLGDDADTTAAIAGQLAGALYGVEAIPAKWRAALAMRERIEELADGLLRLAGALHESGRNAPTAGVDPMAILDAFWVVEDVLLAGPYPSAPTEDEARIKVSALLDLGVRRVIDLTEAGELAPYDALLAELAAERGVDVAHVRLPIRDVSVPTADGMRAILAELRAAADAGELAYVHCWGGVGRTGTVAACLLIEDGCNPVTVIDRLRQLRRGLVRADRISPETPQQRDFVTRWHADGPPPR
jgi:ADP-ribosylglycohydrolase/protein-tyrosine phosphatase